MCYSICCRIHVTRSKNTINHYMQSNVIISQNKSPQQHARLIEEPRNLLTSFDKTAQQSANSADYIIVAFYRGIQRDSLLKDMEQAG